MNGEREDIVRQEQIMEPEPVPVRLWDLFVSFLKIGLFTFGGGYAMIPLIKDEVIGRRKWVREDSFLELLTLAQSAPGPISLNTAVFVGYSARGFKGALCALAGVVLPSFVIILVIAIFFQRIAENKYAAAALKGMRPAVIALMLGPVLGLSKGLGFWRILAALAAAAGVWWVGLSPIYFILAGATVGIALTFRNIKSVPK